MALTPFRNWVAGEIVTATILNQQIRDNGNELWKGTANGDLDYYTSSTTKARLGIGSAGSLLSVVGGIPAWVVQAGTFPFPGSPSVGQTYFRSDLNLYCVWNGTYWLTENEYSIQFPVTMGINADSSGMLPTTPQAQFAPYFTYYAFDVRINTTNNATNYWTIVMRGVDSTYTGTTSTIYSFNTSGLSVGTWTAANGTLSTAPLHKYIIDLTVTKTLSPGALDIFGSAYYHLIVT